MNIQYYSDYDYSLMNNPEYKEDTVREEIIAPLVKMLGYTVGGENKVIRSRALKHPYLTVGSSQRKVTYIPDYLLEVNSRKVLVLDAKSPNEDILSGKNVEQAYSYAIHPEIRTSIYALCNGKSISLFSLQKVEPIIHFELKDILNYWDKLARIIHPEILAKPDIVNFDPDFGLYLMRLGLNENVIHIFIEIHTSDIIKLDDENYSCTTVQVIDNVRFLQTLDFNKQLLPEILKSCTNEYQHEILENLKRRPFRHPPEEYPVQDIVFGAKCKISSEIVHNKEESFVPFIIEEVLHL